MRKRGFVEESKNKINATILSKQMSNHQNQLVGHLHFRTIDTMRYEIWRKLENGLPIQTQQQIQSWWWLARRFH